LKWLRSEGCPWNKMTCYAAAEGGHLEMLKWLRSEACPWDKWTCEAAAEGGHLEMLNWLRSECFQIGNMDMVAYLDDVINNFMND